MIIGIDASRYVHETATGVENYSRNIINGILNVFKNDSNVKIILYSREKLELSLPKNTENKIIRFNRLWTLRGLTKEMKKNPPDVLFVPSHVLPLTLPKKSLITIHDVAFKYLKNAYSFKQYHYLNWSTKMAVKKATKIIVPSKTTASDLVKFYNCPSEKIIVIQHGFTPPAVIKEKKSFNDFEIFERIKLHDSMKFLFFVGRLEIKKNIERLIESFQLFRKVYPDFWLILGGKRGEGFPKILKNVRAKNLLENVFMPGYLTDDEKNFLFRKCKFFVFPSLYEGFGMPILDAFYYEKPILVSDIKVFKEVCQDAAMYCEPNSIHSICESMIKLASNEELRRKFTELGKDQLKKFSWETSSIQTAGLLKSL
jgi:glycosyltransferase involved in cell wall biosynthesis